MNFQQKYAEYKKTIEDYLRLPELEKKLLTEPVLYSLNAGGKRLRPILTMAFCAAYGGDESLALPVACALEMLHTSTLIQDDLPCMDDDDLRRGKPACHKAFSEADAMLAANVMAFSAVGKIDDIRIIKEICNCMQEVCKGQKLDLLYEKQASGKGKDEILHMYALKTCAFLQTCCLSGVLLANADDNAARNAYKYGYKLGLAFQIKDDILDQTSSSEALGKPANSDIKNEKNTYVKAVGLKEAKEAAEAYTKEALELLENVPDNLFLTQLTINLLKRDN